MLGVCVGGGGFLGGSVVKSPLASAGDKGDAGLILGWGRSTVGELGNPFQYSYLRTPRTEEPGRQWSIGSQRIGYDCFIMSSFMALYPLLYTKFYCSWRVENTMREN